MLREADILVVGAGMAGSMLAARLAAAGLKTLVLETGSDMSAGSRKPGTLARIRKRLVGATAHDIVPERWPAPVLLRTGPHGKFREVRATLGQGSGGSGRIYGAALGRARQDDFTTSWNPADWHAGAAPALPNDWPIDFDDFSAYYRQAEALLRIVGTPDPLDPADDAPLLPPPAISPAHGEIVEQLRANGRHPYRMHVGISYRPGCSECQGLACLRDCKSHGFNRALEPAMQQGQPVEIERSITVEQIERLADGRLHVIARDHRGDRVSYHARQIVLAAGALNTPLLLQASANLWGGQVPPLIGAGIMFHYSEIMAVSGMQAELPYGPRKVLAFRDHYRIDGVPYAECQSFGMVPKAGMIGTYLYDLAREKGLPGGLLTQLAARVIAIVAARRYATAELFTAALEDLPYPQNRVSLAHGRDGTERIAITYAPQAEMLVRTKVFRARLCEAFSPLQVRFLNQPGKPNLGHPMGSCRMGSGPETSVVDPDGQVWDQPGIYVADASVFPSSLGVNPALTVAANSLRVADHIIGKQSSAAPSHQAVRA